MAFVQSHPIWSLLAAFVASQLVVVGLLGMCAAGRRSEEVTVVFDQEPSRMRTASDQHERHERHERHAANE